MHGRRTLPSRVIPNHFRLLCEIRQSSGIVVSLSEDSFVEKRLSGGVEVSVENGKKVKSFGSEDLSVTTCSPIKTVRTSPEE